MTLEEKILKINDPKLEDTKVGLLPDGENNTMEDFFGTFVKPRFPEKQIIKKWHKILMDYIDDLSEFSGCVRYGNVGSDKESEYGETKYYKLRRGWLTKNTEDNFEYFFADNFFSSFIYKMAIDGFVPDDANELRDVFKKHKFPYGFGFMIDKKINEYKGVVVAIGEEPGFLNNYKLSHVFDAGENFYMPDGSVLGDTDLSPKYYPIGHSNDFLKEPDKIRKMEISDEAKKVIVAKFLRFAHPMNYFLTPSKKLHTCATHVHMNDIGEDPIMIHYVKQYLKKEYPTEYREFIDKAMWRDDYIGIKYGRPDKAVTKPKKEIKDNTPSGSASPEKSSRDKYGDKKYEVAFYYLTHNDSLKTVEEHVLGCNNSGNTAKSILNKLGINTGKGGHKGLLLSSNTEIAKATGKLKETLEEIKKAGYYACADK